MAGIKAISVANVAKLMSEAIVPLMGKCKGPNHFRAMCRSKVPDRTAKSPYKKPQQQQAWRASTSSNGKGGGKQFFKKKTPKKHPPQKQKAYEVTFKPKTVLKEPSGGKNVGNVSNSVLSGKGPDERGMYNRFSCFAVHSKMAQSTNAKSKPSEGCTQTQTQTIGLR